MFGQFTDEQVEGMIARLLSRRGQAVFVLRLRDGEVDSAGGGNGQVSERKLQLMQVCLSMFLCDSNKMREDDLLGLLREQGVDPETVLRREGGL